MPGVHPRWGNVAPVVAPGEALTVKVRKSPVGVAAWVAVQTMFLVPLLIVVLLVWWYVETH